MLRINNDILILIRQLQPLIRVIARHDANLAKQVHRSSQSVFLNMHESVGRSGGHRRERFETALGEIRETRGALMLAQALGYLQVPPDVDRLADIITATIWKLARPR